MGVINFIIDNILTQASITIALIACLGLILQKKSVTDYYQMKRYNKIVATKCIFIQPPLPYIF